VNEAERDAVVLAESEASSVDSDKVGDGDGDAMS
jgi:hypothetical protein